MNNASANNNEYNYNTGSGMDDFMSRSIDEVSWQQTLGSSYTTLGQLPIGSSPTTATPTNFDASAVSGSVGGSISVGGGSLSGNGGGSSGNIIIDGINGAIKVYDSNNNLVGIIGNLSA
jgi:hypothetical protein